MIYNNFKDNNNFKDENFHKNDIKKNLQKVHNYKK